MSDDIVEMFDRWKNGHAFNEDSDADFELSERVDAALARLREDARAAGAVMVPDGWRLVPIEPTLVMADRAQDLNSLAQKSGWHGAHPLSIYRAMLAAAPSPPTEKHNAG